MAIRIFILLLVIPINVYASSSIDGTYRVNQDAECSDGTRISSTYDVTLDTQGTYSSLGFYTYRQDSQQPPLITYVSGQFQCVGTFSQNQRTIEFNNTNCSLSDLADFSNNQVIPAEIISDYSLEIVESLNNTYFQFPSGNKNLILYNDPAEIETLIFPFGSGSRVCVRQGDGVRLKNNNTVPLPSIEPGASAVF
jgi:hypothetical protein